MSERDWAADAEAMAQATFAEAAHVLADLRKERQSGRPRAGAHLARAAENLQRSVIGWRRLADEVRKANLELEAHRTALTAVQAQQLASILGSIFADLGVPLGPGVRAVVRARLTSADLAPADAERARGELLEALAAEVRERLPDLEPDLSPPERPALPAPKGEERPQEAAAGAPRWAGAVRKVRVALSGREAGAQCRSNAFPAKRPGWTAHAEAERDLSPEQREARVHHDDDYWTRQS